MKEVSLSSSVSIPALSAESMMALMRSCWWRMRAKSPSLYWLRCRT